MKEEYIADNLIITTAEIVLLFNLNKKRAANKLRSFKLRLNIAKSMTFTIHNLSEVTGIPVQELDKTISKLRLNTATPKIFQVV